MHIAITGATGRTGILVVEKLLNQGHSVRGLYRNPDKIELQHPKLTWVKGDVLDLNSLHALVHGTSLVFNETVDALRFQGKLRRRQIERPQFTNCK